MTASTSGSRDRRSPRCLSLVGVGLLAMCWGWPGLAHAGGRDDIKMAYIDAAEQLDRLDLPAAIAIIDKAIADAQADGFGDDPSLAQLYAMRGGLVFANGGAREDIEASFVNAIQLDYNVGLPIELRSRELQRLIEEIRRSVQRPTESVIHTPPVPVADRPIEFAVLFNQALPDAAAAVLYWRPLGESGEFHSLYMDLFGNFATVVVPLEEHGNRSLEYFFYAFEDGQRVLANRGDKERPLVLTVTASDAAAGEEAQPVPEEPEPAVTPDRKRTGGLPLVFIHLGVGTGLGIAHGNAELTYQQYDPAKGEPYGVAGQACAISRWIAGDGELLGVSNFSQQLGTFEESGEVALPSSASELAAAYDRDACSRRQAVRLGAAPALFHVAPEIGVRVHPRIVLSAFARLQVATGSRVFGTDPSKPYAESFTDEVRAADPAGAKFELQSPRFTFAVGAKFRYFFGAEDSKLRLFTGAFAGFGYARLRVPLGFANDRNGNSVPDDHETVWSGQQDEQDRIIRELCEPVWPYNAGCSDVEADRLADYDLSQRVNASAASDERIDTVLLGPGFVGGLFGVHYQVIKYFGVFAEIDAGVWFPNNSSALFDLTLGPVVTF